MSLSSNETENAIIKNMHECIKKIFTPKILEKLFIEFVITRDLKLEYTAASAESNAFLKLFSTQQLQEPQLVWNDETRSEMQERLA